MDFDEGEWNGKAKRVDPLTDLDSIFLLLLEIAGVDPKLHVFHDDGATSTIHEHSVSFNSLRSVIILAVRPISEN